MRDHLVTLGIRPPAQRGGGHGGWWEGIGTHSQPRHRQGNETPCMTLRGGRGPHTFTKHMETMTPRKNLMQTMHFGRR